MANQTIITRLPSQGDPVEILLAKLLAVQSQRVSGTALVSAARTATTQSADIDCSGFTGIIVFLNISSTPGVGGLRILLRAKDPVTGTYGGNGSQTASVSSAGLWVFNGGRGLGPATLASTPNAGAAGVALSDVTRIEIVHSTADSYTYSVGYTLVP